MSNTVRKVNKRRVKGEGSIRKRSDGRWEGRHWVINVDGSKSLISVYGKTKIEAASLLRVSIQKFDNRKAAKNNNMTISQCYQMWIDNSVENYLQPTTVELYQRAYKNYILPLIGKTPVQKICPTDVQNLVNRVFRKSGSARQAHIVKNALSSMLNVARELSIIVENPVRGVKLPKYAAKDKELWDKEELQKFLATAKESSPYYTIYNLLAYCGLRRGEALGIRACDIDLENKYLHIRQQVVPLNNRPVISTPKTKTSIRDLYIDGEILDMLTEAKTKALSEDTLLFTTKSGNPIAPRNLYRDFCRTTEQAGLKHIPIHSLRHMTACFLRDAGVDPKTVQKMLGHATLDMTLKVYQHSNMENKKLAFRKLEEFLAV